MQRQRKTEKLSSSENILCNLVFKIIRQLVNYIKPFQNIFQVAEIFQCSNFRDTTMYHFVAGYHNPVEDVMLYPVFYSTSD